MTNNEEKNLKDLKDSIKRDQTVSLQDFTNFNKS